MIRKLLGLVFNRWVFLAIVVVALALAIWIVGPLVAIGEKRPFYTDAARFVAIGIVVVAVVFLVGIQAWRARRANAAVVDQIVATPPAQAQAERESPDLAAVRERFEQAMQTLRRARFGESGLLRGWSARLGGRFVYELPWYLFIGAPGSGKTTALENCGLRFPLEAQVGDNAVRGVGGTRNCDWWFTDRAVLIDTAGRFTTQDSDAASDAETWRGFLGILKRARPRQPINGVLLTVAIPDLLARPAADRERYAVTVRSRLQELHAALGTRIPVYLIVTKCDLLAGFMDYFATLDKEQRADAWGVTFPVDEPTSAHLATFGAEFGALQKRLDDGLVDTVQAEHDPQRRARIYGFPNQFACVRPPLEEFLATVFSPSAYARETLLRGIYFISGTQEGTPIDRVMGTVARAFGLQRAVIAPNQAAGRSYFLLRLLGDVVFAERGLAGTNRAWERRRAFVAFGAYALLAFVVVGLVVAWSNSYVGNKRYVDEVAARAEKVRQRVISANANVSIDPRTVTPTLDPMRHLAESSESSWKLGFGLSQERKLKTAERNAYDRMLYALLLPNLEMRLEDRIAQGSDQPESQYESLKAYLMLHDPEHFDADALKRYFDADTERRFGRTFSEAERASVDAHVDALLAEGASPTLHPPDKTLIDAARAQILRQPLPQRVLARLRAQGLGDGYPDFTIERAAGSATRLIFSPDALAAKVPGLYSYDGYHKGFDAQVASAVRQLNEEQSWVLGVADARAAGSPVVADAVLESQVRRLYLVDYAAAWKAFIALVRLKPLGNSSDAIAASQQLSAPDSPLRPLLRKMSRETTLAGPRAPTGASSLSSLSGLSSELGSLVQKGKAVAGAIGAPKVETAGELERTLVDDQFEPLRALVSATPDGKAPLDRVIAQIADVQSTLIAADRAVQAGNPPPPTSATPALMAEASQLPEPVRSLLTTLTQQGSRQTLAGLRLNLSNEVRSTVGDFCQQAIARRYPFDRTAQIEVLPQDFAQLFGPGGKLDQLMTKLAPYVDTATRTWRFKPVDGQSLGESGSLVQLQRAQTIRDTFFPGTTVPTIRVNFKPLEMDPALTVFNLDVDGTAVRYQHGPQYATTVTWPGQHTTNQVRLSVTPAPPPGTPDLTFEGPWALLRMVDHLKLEPTAVPERFVATFTIAQHWAKFEVSATSVRNPLNMPELREFRCPLGL